MQIKYNNWQLVKTILIYIIYHFFKFNKIKEFYLVYMNNFQ